MNILVIKTLKNSLVINELMIEHWLVRTRDQKKWIFSQKKAKLQKNLKFICKQVTEDFERGLIDKKVKSNA